jgi:acyl-CoA synthetase (AMP-forming)/AMP-acid ligase II
VPWRTSSSGVGRTVLANEPTTLAASASAITLAAIFRRSARLFADRVAVVGPDRRLTYRELDERSTRVANALLRAGFGPGDRIAVLSNSLPEFVELYVAAAKLGVTVVALNTRLHAQELGYCIRLSRPRVIFAAADQRASLEAAGDDATGPDILCFGGDETGYEQFLAGGGTDEPRRELSPEAIHNVLFTSGTTGRPKGAMISQRAAAVRAFRCAQWFGLGPEDGFIGWLPLFHCGGDEPLYATLLSGGRIATFERPDPEAMFRAVERERLTWTLLLPGVISEFLHHPRRANYDLSSMRFAIGYANMMPQVVKAFTASVADFWDAFGQTESSFLVAYGHVPRGDEPSLRKRPTPLLDIRIVDEDMDELPPGVPGECVVRGPSVMSGYLEDAEATAEAFRGGWLHTGDVLVRHEDGTLSYVDRKKYLIKTGGENVYPAEVESVIASHPAVQEVCVVGIPDEYWGETIKAVVVLAPGQALAAPALVQWCRERLAGYKRPRYVQFLSADELPRSTTGKLLRHQLAALPVTDEQRVP